MLKNVERETFERCVAHVTLRPDDFSMEDRVEAHVVRGGTVQFHNITVTYAPTKTSRAYRSALPSAWSGQFRKDLDDGVFY
ncbi:hypothetical protein [Azospirillum sp. TSO22-1]|uniref:hypothetical protein n=1 Tax=Azospirillum sp. TSO22-1 TaxID=716789 RepID=UPI000D61FBFD|nr:hypothetical protein [Azospirillum sp. TSO22-1]PWC45773.1 hypothetical protein TSO221_15915 [Azospirillum sp. TSO22-1]